jgi:teichuronic acid biosynthesis glycosyltransferase TuaH
MSNSKKGLFYFMHIPWTWAKQRPQFLAQELKDTFDITVAYKKPFSTKNQSLETAELPLLSIAMLPYNAKSVIVRFFNKLLTRRRVRKIIYSCKYVWVTSPDLFDLLPKLRNDQILIYDCMDDMLSFSSIKDYPNVYKYYHKVESKLLKRADLVICSSNNLKDKLVSRYQIGKEVFIINNGISEEMFKAALAPQYNSVERDSQKINIVYIGTIAKWMDWDLVLKSIELNSDILYHFVGPQETIIPEHKNILFYGPKPHKEIKSIMAAADILLMPFQVTDLIRSVNPVKLYEYIYSNKASISVRYDETELFEKYVYLYSNIEEYMSLIDKLKSSQFLPKLSAVEAEQFCRDNTWTVRGKYIKKILLNSN